MAEGERCRSVVLLSGGLDSAANLAICRERDQPVLALTADYGQRAVRAEIRAARALADYYEVEHQGVDLPWLGGLGGSALTRTSIPVPVLQPDELDEMRRTKETARAVWVPNRNGVLIQAAAAFAERLGCVQVVVGFNAEEAVTFPDNSRDFMERATRALALSTANGARVSSYTVDWDKRRIVQELEKLARPFPFDLVWSCYLGGTQPCGSCESCQRLRRAYLARAAAGILA